VVNMRQRDMEEIKKLLSDKKFLNRLLSIARKRAGERCAEDARSASILRILEKAHMFDPTKGCAEAWAVTVATRCSLNVVKLDPMKKEVTSTENEDGVTPILDGIASPIGDDRDAEIAGLMVAISTLEEGEKALAMMVVEGVGQVEIGKALGMSQGAVSKRIAKILPKLREAMQK
jgi:RNA polymerase sigma factor (sigma-70 family)